MDDALLPELYVYLAHTCSFWETSPPIFFQLVLVCLDVYKLSTAAPVAH